jgi:hypothetical protein
MWWRAPALRGFDVLLPARLLELVAKSYVLASAEIQAPPPLAGRLLERAFYRLTETSGMQLCETAGSRSLFKFKSSSRYGHEIDGSISEQAGLSVWELKNLVGCVPKNDLLIFNSKILDYYQSFDRFFSAIPLYRLLLTTSNVALECRHYGACTGIIIIDSHLMPMPLLYEAIARGMSTLPLHDALHAAETLRWACRPLQAVVCELCRQTAAGVRDPSRRACAAVDLQIRLSAIVSERLQQDCPDWEDELLVQSWRDTGGWVYQGF